MSRHDESGNRNEDSNNRKHDKENLEETVPFYIEKLTEVFYEKKYNIDTFPTPNIKNERVVNFSYEPTPYSFLEYLFLKYPFSSDDHFVDFGCGKGRTLIMASEYSCAYVTGYEINNDIFIILNNNIMNYKKTSQASSKIILVNQDVSTISIDDTMNKFYFANPFHLKIYIKVIHSILESLKRKPREIYLFLYMPNKSTLEYLKRIPLFMIKDSESIYGSLPLYIVLTNQ